MKVTGPRDLWTSDPYGYWEFDTFVSYVEKNDSERNPRIVIVVDNVLSANSIRYYDFAK